MVKSHPAILGQMPLRDGQDHGVVLHGFEERFGIHARQDPSRANARAGSKLKEFSVRFGGCESAQKRSSLWLGSHLESQRLRRRQNRVKNGGLAGNILIIHGYTRMGLT